jgi:hypothetical protein
MGVSKVPLRGEKELCIFPVSSSGAELGKAMSSVWLAAHEGAEGNGFGGNAGKDIKRMSRNNVGKVRDHGNAVPGIGGLVSRGVNGWGRVRKSRGRVRM